MNLTKEFLLDELERNDLDHVVTWFNKRYHRDGTLGNDGKCSRGPKCNSVKAEPKYTVIVKVYHITVHSLALCKECYKESPYSDNN